MDSSPRPPAHTRLPPRALAVLLAVCVAAYVFFLVQHSASYAGGADASGYFNSARLLGQGRFYAPVRMPAGHGHTEFGLMAFQPLGFIMDEKAPHMAPTYPIGLPLHLYLAHWLTGWNHASTLVNVLAALASGGLLWSLARQVGLTAGWAATAVALLWLCPLSLFATLQPMSDELALMWSLATLWAALRSREKRCWSVLAGAAFSLAVLVRPTCGLLLLPVVVAFGFDLPRYVGLGLGGLPGGIFFCYYNWRVYGSPLATGYGDVSTAFSSGFVAPNLAHFARWIPVLLTPLVCAALAAPFLRAARRREFAVLGLWAVMLVGFYAFYFHSGETWWYIRFILPAFPALILAALVAVQQPWSRLTSPVRAWSVLAAVLALAAVWQVRLTRRLEVLEIPPGEAHYLHAADWARQHLPPNAAVFCMQVSGALHFYADFMVIRWDQALVARMPELFAALQQEKRPVYAALYEFETADALKRMGGRWTKLETVGNTTFWQLNPAPAAP